ncbi:MAG TPA: hypothetical protein VIS71_04160, partial [Terrimicrobium sp.]
MILAHTDVAVGFGGKPRSNFTGVVVPDLHGENPAWRQARRGGVDHSPDEVKAVRPPVKRWKRVVPDLALKDGKFAGRHIWQIGDNPVEASFAGRKKIRFMKGDLSI